MSPKRKAASIDWDAPDEAVPAPSPGSRTLSPQQQAVQEWVRTGRGSGFVQALAGTGKTTTIIEACRYMHGSVAFAAFNKKIATEIQSKIGIRPGVRVGTFHSFGLSSWKRVADPSLKIDEPLKSKMMMEGLQVPYPLRNAVKRLVSIAKQGLVGLEWDGEDDDRWRELIDYYTIMLNVDEIEDEERTTKQIIDFAKAGVDWAAAEGRKLIDFDDMIWLPLLNDAPVYQQDWVVVDEAQDTNPARRLLAARMLKPGGRSLWVGDEYQAIYGFTGASSDSVDQIIRDFNCHLMPLTVTFRCSKAATDFAKTWVPAIEAHAANAEGSVSSIATAQGFESRYMGRSPVTVPDTSAILGPGDAVLCRVNRPLVSLAFQLIRAGIGCHVEGRDIGRQLDALARRWKVKSADGLIKRLEDYRERETTKMTQRHDNPSYLLEALNDRIDTLIIIAENCDTLEEVRAKIDVMFEDTEDGRSRTVTLSSVHKAKGREWERVFILGWNAYMPSKWATKPWQRQQEKNLQYVAVTRTKRDLILLPSLERNR